MSKKIIYLDNAATTPVDPAVFSKMKPYFMEKYGNASSIHQIGQEARQAIENARQQVAIFLNCLPEEVYFTSGATESDNTIKGIIEKAKFQGVKNPHIITSAIEHKAVLDLCQVLEKKGIVELTVLPINKDGLVEIKTVEKAIKKNTVLISIMYANSEIGTIQPIREIGQLIKKLNSKKKDKIFFHTDAVQAINYLNCEVNYLNVDLLSLSGHKIYGPKGIGVLYIRKGTPISSLIRGGGHERGVRSGTENVPGIVGLGEAVNRVNKVNHSQNQKIKQLRNKLITGILRDIPKVSLNGSAKERLPNNAHFSFEGIEGEGIVFDLSSKGVFASTSSACASHSLAPSHVLLAIGLKAEDAHSSVRFTLGKQTTSSNIDYVLKILPGIVKRLRKIAGYKHV